MRISTTWSRKNRSRRNLPAWSGLLDGLVRRRNDAHVHSDRAVPADALKGMTFEHPQQLRLSRQVQLAYFVQEDRAAIGRLKLADLLFGCSREGPFLVSEQLALQQGLRKGGTVQADKRPVLATARVVQSASDKLLPGSAFTSNQHRGVSIRNQCDLSLDVFDSPAVAHQLAFDAKLIAQRTVLCRQRGLPLLIVNRNAQLAGHRQHKLEVLGIERAEPGFIE